MRLTLGANLFIILQFTSVYVEFIQSALFQIYKRLVVEISVEGSEYPLTPWNGSVYGTGKSQSPHSR
jgi:hypothetical protein